MDVKPELINHYITDSILLIMNSGVDYEFRTTVVPQLQTTADFMDIDSLIKGAKRYFLQAYRQPQNSEFYYDEPDMEYMKRIASVMTVPTFIRGI